jgi:uncharacterized protein YdeI (YjbR/CyaY-like superfamily)
MPTPLTNPAVDAYLRTLARWREETEQLRALALGSGLTEELKWGKPCYTFQGANVVILQAFKDSCTLLFCKGALLADPGHLLHKPGENTQAARVMRFTSTAEINKNKAAIKSYIKEAIAAEKAGLEISYKKISEFTRPAELERKLAAQPALKRAFEALTPGRQRAYLLHFSAAKQSATRAARVDKCVPRILAGRGLNDR